MDNKLKTPMRPRSYLGLSLAILVLVAGAAGGLAVVNKGLSAEVQAKQEQIDKIEAEIAKLKEDKTVVLSDMIKANQAEVAKAVGTSRVQDYVEALSLLEAKYGVTFDGFSFQAGRISTSLVAEADDKTAAVRKLQALIKDARDNGGLAVTLSNNAAVMLDLGRITYVAGDDARRVASITFDVK